jgi:DNA-binding NarL/FixJ family response regulator
VIFLEEHQSCPPCLVLALHNPVASALASQDLRSQGWNVVTTSSGQELRCLADHFHAELVILDTELAGDSGWLTCAKLLLERPGTRVILVANHQGDFNPEFARFVGAAGIVSEIHHLYALVQELREANLASV